MPNKHRANGTLLIDGDLLCYRLATCRDFLEEAYNDDDERWYVFNMADAVDELHSRVQEALTISMCHAAIFAFGGKDNFRRSMIDATYKSNRVGRAKPLGYFAFCDKVAESYQVLRVPTLEADDILGIYHTSPRLLPGRSVVYSDDKDLRGIPGELLFSDRDKLVRIVVSDASAITFWMRQTLIGDQSDGYAGCPGVGKIKAERIIDDAEMLRLICNDGADTAAAIAFLTMVVPEFVSRGLAYDDALRQARLARILRRGDCNVTADHVEVQLWDPNASNYRVAHSSKVRSKKLLRRTHTRSPDLKTTGRKQKRRTNSI